MLEHEQLLCKQYALSTVIRLGVLSILSVLFTVTSATAQPELHLPSKLISQRTFPASFKIDDYKGTIQRGTRQIQYFAPGGRVSWQPWTNLEHIAVVAKAIQIVERRAVKNKACNSYFANQMPRGNSFAQIWNATGSDRIRISYSAGFSGIWRAATYGNSAPFDWTVTESTVKLGPESVASALVHEATRTNGVGSKYAIAFRAERVCGMVSFLVTEKVIRDLGWQITRTGP